MELYTFFLILKEIKHIIKLVRRAVPRRLTCLVLRQRLCTCISIMQTIDMNHYSYFCTATYDVWCKSIRVGVRMY